MLRRNYFLLSAVLRESAVGASPIRQGKKVSFPSRAAEPLVCRYGSAPLSGQKACWSLTERPFYKNGNQGGTAKDISSLRLRQSNLGAFFIPSFPTKNKKE